MRTMHSLPGYLLMSSFRISSYTQIRMAKGTATNQYWNLGVGTQSLIQKHLKTTQLQFWGLCLCYLMPLKQICSLGPLFFFLINHSN